MKPLEIISFTDTSGKTLIHLDLINALPVEMVKRATFIISHNKPIIYNPLYNNRFIIIADEVSRIYKCSTSFNIPFFRVILTEILSYFLYRKLKKKIANNQVDFIITNNGLKNVTKYFSSFCKRNYNTKILTYIYGMGLRNSIYSKLNKEGVFGIYPKKNIISNLINIIELIMSSMLLNVLGLLKWYKYSKFNYGCDYIMVKSQIDKKIFLQHGFSLQMVHVIGSVWDEISKKKLNKNILVKERNILIISTTAYELDYKKIANQPTYFDRLDLLIENLIHDQENYNIYVKFHPRESKEKYRSLIFKYPMVKWISHGEASTTDLILEASLVIVQYSTVILDIIKLKKNMIFYEFQMGLESPFQTFKNLFLNASSYNIEKSISYNISLSKKMTINNKEYSQWVQSVDLKKEFKKFLITFSN